MCSEHEDSRGSHKVVMGFTNIGRTSVPDLCTHLCLSIFDRIQGASPDMTMFFLLQAMEEYMYLNYIKKGT